MKLIFKFIIIFSLVTQAQNKDNYYFDFVSKISIKNNSTGINEVKYVFSNSNDSTYNLELKYFSKYKIALLNDNNKNTTIEFKLDFDYKSINDLEKLINPNYNKKEKKLNQGKRFLNYFEEIEYENDSLNNQIIVHITQFKNKKKKDILNDHYYFFSQKKELINFKQSDILNYLIYKKQLELLKGYHFEKSMCLIDGKINSEFETYFIEKIDYNLKLKD